MNTCSIDGEISLSGAEIFKKMVNFENGLHKNNCVQFLKTTEEQRQEEPNLRLKFLKKQDECSCSEKFLEKVIGISNRISEMKLVDLYTDANVRNYICDGKYYNDENIVLRLVLHLQDICMEKGFRVLRRALQVGELSGYDEIFACFVDFENELHKKCCVTFFPVSGDKEQMIDMPKLRLTLVEKKGNCKCSENFLDKVKGTLDNVQESKLVYIFKVYLQEYIWNKNIYDEDIVCRLVRHLQDICKSRNLQELEFYCFQTNPDLVNIFIDRFDEMTEARVLKSESESELEVKDLSGYKEIFDCFVDFENELHKTKCITFLPVSGDKEQMIDMPKLSLNLLDKKHDCKCSENFLDEVKGTLDNVQDSKLVHIFKVYLQGYVRNKNIYDRNIACRLVQHLLEICISKSLPELARYCFRTYYSTVELKQILTKRFDELSDKITAVIISEMDSERATF